VTIAVVGEECERQRSQPTPSNGAAGNHYREYRSTNSITEIISPSLVLNMVIEPQDLEKDLIDEKAATIALSERNGNHPWTEIHF
jgi:hypothetical protein